MKPTEVKKDAEMSAEKKEEKPAEGDAKAPTADEPKKERDDEHMIPEPKKDQEMTNEEAK